MPHCKMLKRRFIIILFFIQGNLLFSQTAKDSSRLTQTIPQPLFLLKVDLRSVMLQPKLSCELFATKRLSIEIGACYFWTGQKVYQQDFYQQGMLTSLLGIGPSKGNDIFSDIKYSKDNGTYFGIGYFYRYSHFSDKHLTADVGDRAYQYYNQSENAYSNYLRLTAGFHRKLKNKNIYVNPYAALMIGRTNFHLTIDTTGGEPVNYSRDVLPIDEKKIATKGILIIGLNFCFDFFHKARKPD
jgi:hypothetical protein